MPPPDVVGAQEIAELLGVTRQAVDKLARTDRTFPRPKVIAAGRIWWRREIEAWARKTGRLA